MVVRLPKTLSTVNGNPIILRLFIAATHYRLLFRSYRVLKDGVRRQLNHVVVFSVHESLD
jgi:hypothetical protein